MRRFLLLLALSLSACAAPPPPGDPLPPDVPDPSDVRVLEGRGFRLCIDGGCLSTRRTMALLAELDQARARILEILGPARAPGDFRPYGEDRTGCPSSEPWPLPPRIDVVILREGDRCHADRDGLTVLARHLPRHDATHELVHFLAGSSWRPVDEGLAVYLTDRIWGPAAGFPAKIRARVFLDLSLDRNLYPDVVRAGMSRRDYDVAGAFVGWLIEAYGAERFWRLYHGPVRNYHPVYGMPETELWERFWRYIGNLDVRHSGPYHAFKGKLTGNLAPQPREH